jgi:hypothetical protein
VYFLQTKCCSAPWLALKTHQAGAGSASAASVNSTVKTKGVDHGTYVWWKDPNAAMVGKQVIPQNVATFTRFEQCVEACDYDWKCAAVFMQSKVQIDQSTGYNMDGPKSCRLIQGDTSPGTNKRTVIKADTNKTAIPVYQKGGTTGAVDCRRLPPQPLTPMPVGGCKKAPMHTGTHKGLETCLHRQLAYKQQVHGLYLCLTHEICTTISPPTLLHQLCHELAPCGLL